MTREEIVKQFKDVLKSHTLDIEKVTDDTKLSEDLSIDSLDLVEIVMELEDKFKIVIPESEMSNLKTFGELVSYIEKQLKK